MNYTGERPTLEHGSDGSLLRYHSILPFVKDKRVIDWACGCGIGTRYLKPYCDSIVGYDHDKEAIEEAQRLSPDIEFYTDLSKLEEQPNLYVMNEFIEHISPLALEQLLSTIKTDLVGTTPNGDLFKYDSRIEPKRGYHILHYTQDTLKNLLLKYYTYVEVYGAIWDPKLSEFTSYNFCCSF